MIADTARPEYADFCAWAKDHLAQGCSLATEEGDFTDSKTRIAFSAYRAGRIAGMEAAAVICAHQRREYNSNAAYSDDATAAYEDCEEAIRAAAKEPK
jgi:hypothetical protein